MVFITYLHFHVYPEDNAGASIYVLYLIINSLLKNALRGASRRWKRTQNAHLLRVNWAIAPALLYLRASLRSCAFSSVSALRCIP
jgi:hypothetical protein